MKTRHWIRSFLPTVAGLIAFARLTFLPLTAQPSPDSPQAPPTIPVDQIGRVAGQHYQGDGLSVTATPDGARLRCDFQQLAGWVTSEGLWLGSTANPATGEHFRLLATAVGRGADRPRFSTALAPTGSVSVAGSLVRFLRAGLTEEYSTGMDGVRQDFIVEQKPPGAGELRLELELTGARAELSRKGVRLVLEGSGRKLAYSRLHVVDADGKELTARMEVVNESLLTLAVQDDTATYPIRIDPTFSDDDWGSMGGILGADRWVYAAVADGAGNLYVGGSFEMVGDVRVNHVARWNGSEWSDLGGGLDWEVWALAVSGTDLYVGGDFSWAGKTETEAGIPVNRIARWDGTTWSALGTGIGVEPGRDVWDYVTSLAVIGNDVYAGGFFGIAGGTEVSNVAKWDGSTWSALGSGMDDEVYALAVIGTDVYAGGGFTMAGGTEVNYVARWNGSSWSALGSGMDDWVYSLATMGTDLYVGGDFWSAGEVPAQNIARWDGSTWSSVGSGLDARVTALAVSGTDLYAGGQFSTAGETHGAYYVAKWSGDQWSALGLGVDDYVSALAVVGDTLFVGGDFELVGGEVESVGGVPTLVGQKTSYYIARWDGGDWSAVGSASGLSGVVRSLAVMGTTLYAGGSFTTASVNPANNIARWDGSRWLALESGLDGPVYALQVEGTNLIAGGYFRKAGGTEVLRVARWNGSAWSPLGAGLNSGVVALTMSGTNLYAGGDFNMSGETPVSGIALWNGQAWSSVGDGVVGGVFALAGSKGLVYAGGAFVGAGGLQVNFIAQWNGSVWSALGEGMDSQVHALTMMGSDLYAGGVFSTAGGVIVNGIARWDGQSWSALGSGVSEGNSVLALTVSGTDLYVGGTFRSAGGQPANSIAKWDGSAWSALGSGTQGMIHALAVLGSDLYAGGDFISIGNRISAHAAKARIGVSSVDGGSLGNLSYVPATGFRFTFTGGTPGQSYRIQSSPSMTAGSWSPVTNFNYSAPVVLTDPVVAGVPGRFYRVVSP